uniref:Doublecortin domain-containing protein n=1 Tax=Syphacia muris TaxID=451379 RepID=A0A0N5AHY5_9BILA
MKAFSVFLNGHGLDSQCIHFQRTQLERGMSYVLEIIARGFGVNPAKLCNMDGSRVKQVTELMSRGAYILVPVSQGFRDAWYFLPDNAIDTSPNADKGLQGNKGNLLKSNTQQINSSAEFQNVANRIDRENYKAQKAKSKKRVENHGKSNAKTNKNNDFAYIFPREV